MYCAKCGASLPGDAQFCTGCGTNQVRTPVPLTTSFFPKKAPRLNWKLILPLLFLAVTLILILLLREQRSCLTGGWPVPSIQSCSEDDGSCRANCDTYPRQDDRTTCFTACSRHYRECRDNVDREYQRCVSKSCDPRACGAP